MNAVQREAQRAVLERREQIQARRRAVRAFVIAAAVAAALAAIVLMLGGS